MMHDLIVTPMPLAEEGQGEGDSKTAPSAQLSMIFTVE